MGGKKGVASTKQKRSKKTVKPAQSRRSVSQPKKASPRYGHFVSLHDELAAIGLRVTTVLADGNCFFRAISDQRRHYGLVHWQIADSFGRPLLAVHSNMRKLQHIFQISGQEIEHHKVRAEVVQYMQAHSDVFSPFVEDDEGFDKYIARMQKETTWAGHMEVQAASLCYGVNICIYQSGQPTWRVINFKPVDSQKCLHLSYHDGDHYNSVRGMDDPGDGPAKPISLHTRINHVQDLPAKIAFGEQQVRMVAENTLCFNTNQVKHALRECGGDVHNATELLISRMASQNAEEPDDQLIDDDKTASARICELPTQSSVATQLSHLLEEACESTVPREHGEYISIKLEVSQNRVNLRMFRKEFGKEGQPAPHCRGGPAVQAATSTNISSRSRRKRNKQPGSRPGIADGRKPSNNKPCSCNSGRRYKHCCKAKDLTAPEAKSSAMPAAYVLLKQLDSLDI